MTNGWTVPAVGIFILTQAAAAIWWASGTNTKVENNTTAIEKVIKNEKEIAVIEAQQQALVSNIQQIRLTNKEMRETINEIHRIMISWDE